MFTKTSSAFSTSHPRRKTTAFRVLFAFRFPVLLFLCLSGPLPWFHCHGTLANAGEASVDPSLRIHLATQHANISPYADLYLEWHVHVGLPTPSSDGSNESHDSEQNRLPAQRCLHALTFLINGQAPIETLSVGALHCGRLFWTQVDWPSPTSQFFESFAPSLPLPMRFCVMRN